MQIEQKLLTQVLNFRPLSGPSPVYPPIVVNGVQISGFESKTEPLFLHESFEKIFSQIYPKLSLPELARLATSLTALGLTVEPFLEVYGFRNNEILKKVFEFVLELPEHIQDHLSEKDFSIGDVRSIIPQAEHSEKSLSFLVHCIYLRMSKSQIIESVELANELFALGSYSWDEKADKEKLIESLKRHRHPIASQRDQQRHQNVKTQKWPHRSQVRWTRQGDLSGLEIKLFVTSPAEYTRAVSEISKISPEEVWK